MGEDFHSSTSWLKIFFDIFWESNGIWSNKIWTGSWLVSEGLPGLIAEPLTWLCPCAWCHYCMCMTHDNMTTQRTFPRSWLSLLTGSAHAPYPGYSHTMYAVLWLPGPCQCWGNIYNLLWSEDWVARSQSAESCIHSITTTHAPSPGQNYPFWPELIVILPREAHASKWITDTLLRTDIGVGGGSLGREELSKCRYKAGDWC